MTATTLLQWGFGTRRVSDLLARIHPETNGLEIHHSLSSELLRDVGGAQPFDMIVLDRRRTRGGLPEPAPQLADHPPHGVQ